MNPPITFGIELEFLVGSLEPGETHPQVDEKRLAHFQSAPEGTRVSGYYSDDTSWDVVAKHIVNTLNEAGIPTLLEGNLFEKWCLSNDVSVYESKNLPDGYFYHDMELKSPILTATPENFAQIERVCQLITEKYCAVVNQTTGLHIHVGYGDTGYTFEHLRRFAAFIYAFEPQLSTLMPYHRISSVYCIPLRQSSTFTHDFLNTNDLNMPATAVAVAHILGCEYTSDLRNASNVYSYCAYNMLNALQFLETGQSNKRTIEFRQHAATFDGRAITVWAKTVMGIVDWTRRADPLDFTKLLNICAHEKWQKLGYGRDVANEEKYGPILAESRFTVIDLFMHMGLHVPALYYCQRKIFIHDREAEGDKDSLGPFDDEGVLAEMAAEEQHNFDDGLVGNPSPQSNQNTLPETQDPTTQSDPQQPANHTTPQRCYSVYSAYERPEARRARRAEITTPPSADPVQLRQLREQLVYLSGDSRPTRNLWLGRYGPGHYSRTNSSENLAFEARANELWAPAGSGRDPADVAAFEQRQANWQSTLRLLREERDNGGLQHYSGLSKLDSPIFGSDSESEFESEPESESGSGLDNNDEDDDDDDDDWIQPEGHATQTSSSRIFRFGADNTTSNQDYWNADNNNADSSNIDGNPDPTLVPFGNFGNFAATRQASMEAKYDTPERRNPPRRPLNSGRLDSRDSDFVPSSPTSSASICDSESTQDTSSSSSASICDSESTQDTSSSSSASICDSESTQDTSSDQPLRGRPRYRLGRVMIDRPFWMHAIQLRESPSGTMVPHPTTPRALKLQFNEKKRRPQWKYCQEGASTNEAEMTSESWESKMRALDSRYKLNGNPFENERRGPGLEDMVSPGSSPKARK